MLFFLNYLFDSFNGKQGQGLNSIITMNNGHIQFWQEACKQLINMRYGDKKTKKVPKKKCSEMFEKLNLDDKCCKTYI